MGPTGPMEEPPGGENGAFSHRTDPPSGDGGYGRLSDKRFAPTSGSHRGQAVESFERCPSRTIHHLAMVATGEMSRFRAFSHLADPPSGEGGYRRNESTGQGTHRNRPNLSKDARLTRCNDVS
jgi:hypothetical protein